MGRLLALDVGRKRTGIAVTDPLRIIPGGLGTVPTTEVPDRLAEYLLHETVDALIVGEPHQADGSPSESSRYIEPLLEKIRHRCPTLPIIRYDERYTSVLAQKAILDSGIPKMKRRDKGLVDEVSAVIILRDFMDSKAGKDYLCQSSPPQGAEKGTRQPY